MKILITGIAGFIGSHLARALCDHEIVGIDDLSTGAIKNLPSFVEFIEGDVVEVSQSLNASFDVILHFAGQSSGEKSCDDPVNDARRNLLSTVALIQFCNRSGFQGLFVYASSMAVYGDMPEELSSFEEDLVPHPLSPYGLSKAASEKYIQAMLPKNSFCCLRLFNVYGPGQNLNDLKQGMVSIFLAQALKAEKIEVRGALDRVRDFIYVEDVVEVVKRLIHLTCCNNAAIPSILNVCSGLGLEVGEIIAKINQLVGDPKPVCCLGPTPKDQVRVVGSDELLSTVMPKEWCAKSFDQGIEEFVRYVIDD